MFASCDARSSASKTCQVCITLAPIMRVILPLNFQITHFIIVGVFMQNNIIVTNLTENDLGINI